MKKLLLTLSLVSVSMISVSHASILDAATPNVSVCRDAFVNLMGESANNSKVNFKKTLDGVDSKGAVCSFKISLYETTDLKKGLINIDAPLLNPFNHSMPAENSKKCDNNAQEVKGFYSFKQDSGWHHRFTSKLSLSKSAENGKISVTYRQEGSTITCTGELK
jgi:hypothetical protein